MEVTRYCMKAYKKCALVNSVWSCVYLFSLCICMDLGVRSLSLSGGFTPCRHISPSLGREHTFFFSLLQSGDDYLMNETRRKPTTGRRCPTLFDKWPGIFYMPSRRTRLDIPRPLITQSHRHGWTYQGL